MTRPFHVFPELGVDLLCGVDTLREEGIDMYYSSTLPQIRIASCRGAAVAIDVCDGEKVRKVPVRTTESTVIPANSTAVIAVKIPRSLPSNQDYLFTPNKLRSVATSGTGAPHAVFSHEQKKVLFTNLQDTDITLFDNTVIGHLHCTASENVAVWHEAAQDCEVFWASLRLQPPWAPRQWHLTQPLNRPLTQRLTRLWPFPSQLSLSPLNPRGLDFVQ
jgi:hypothetical protein